MQNDILFSVPRVGLALIIVRGDKVLLHLRNGKHAPGLWGFPGGHLEKFEEFDDCALRELEEEARPNIKVSYPKLFTTTNGFYKEEDKHYITIFMRSEWYAGEAQIMEPDKCTEWRWFTWDELSYMLSDLLPGIRTLIHKGYNPINCENALW